MVRADIDNSIMGVRIERVRTSRPHRRALRRDINRHVNRRRRHQRRSRRAIRERWLLGAIKSRSRTQLDMPVIGLLTDRLDRLCRVGGSVVHAAVKSVESTLGEALLVLKSFAFDVGWRHSDVPCIPLSWLEHG